MGQLVPTRWRLLRDGAARGPFNMGVDEALLESTRAGTASLRFYTWDGPWLSLGYSQRIDPARAARCAEAGVGIVRRVTGGLAVLHGADLTYCVAAPEEVLPDGLRGSYRLVAAALVEGLRSLGVAVQSSVRREGGTASSGFDCFEVPAEDEICVTGRKLVGSAQRRARGGVLQHGSIRLAPDPPEATRAVGFAPGVATSLAELGIAASANSVEEVLAAAFRSTLEVPLEEGMLSAAERRFAERRAAERGDEARPRRR
jgi:lipoate-protein ligase A